MRLKSLEIRGFKSFGDKVRIQFDADITGIIGPNGCGKSNVIDAIRWVLGEQKTKALRSEKMENVLFNGTKNRKQTNLAEVTICFENTKSVLNNTFNEVAITRKLYRSGESEYQINHIPCRLKDISNLFLDTGIGNDSYAIMELKMIDEVLQDKENSRRMLFEEAAGISKYRVRKKETLAKIEEVEKDINRISDILFEIDKNVKTLQSQAKKTEKYYQLKGQLKIATLNLAYFDTFNWQQKIAKLNNNKQDIEKNKIFIEKSIADTESTLAHYKKVGNQKDVLFTSRQKATQTFKTNLLKIEQEQKLQNQQFAILKEKEYALDKNILADESRLNELKKQVDSLNAILKEDDEKCAVLQIDVENLKLKTEQIFEKLKKEKEIEQELRKQLQTKQNNLNVLEKNKAITETQLKLINRDVQAQLIAIEQSKIEFSEFGASIISLKEALKEQNKILLDATNFEEELQLKLAEKIEQIERTKLVLNSLHRQLDAQKNEYKLQKSLVDNLEGFPESVKFLKKNSHFAKKAQLLSDIISCDASVKLAIENYLEPVLNYYVVDSFKDAFSGISLLAEASKGKANFFIREAFSEFNTTHYTVPNSLVSSISYLEFDEEYTNLVHFLLGNVFLVNVSSLQTDNELIYLQKQFPKLVLLSNLGNLQIQQFKCGGGSVGLFDGKRLGRKRNLDILAKSVLDSKNEAQKLLIEIEALQKDFQVLKEATLQKKITDSKSKILQLEQQIFRLTTKQEQQNQFIGLEIEKTNKLNEQKIAFEKKLLDYEQEIGQLSTSNNSLTEFLDQHILIINKLYDNHQQTNATYNQQNLLLHQAKNKRDNLFNELTYKQKQIQTLKVRVNDYRNEKEQINAKILAVNTQNSVSDSEIAELNLQLAEMEFGVIEVEKEFFEIKNQIVLTEEELQLKRKKNDENNLLLQSESEKVLEAKINFRSFLERLSVQFELPISEIESVEKPEISETELESQVNTLKQKLSNYGPINPLALDAYNEAEERQRFISNQHNDLKNAKEALELTISEIDLTAKAKFLESFSKIRQNFITVFRSLFSELDTCDLVLTDSDNPLEAKIQILAMPKGKKPLTINQLSGGEKTLTAIALLFGIYLFKPAPFCIFDEVDAPLDDTNIEKFNQIIKKFSQQSQFILVTHNKKTMEAIDVIYGITMVEQGISKIVPVDLRNIFDS